MHLKSLVAAALFAAIAVPALAQAPQGTPTNVRGKIVKLDGQNLAVKSPGGATLVVALAPDYRISTLVRKKLSDIKPGDFVGITSVPGKDNKLHAVEIHFFAPNSPVRDSQNPWDSRPGATMTNAHVTGTASGTNGSVLSVDYKSGTAQVIVDKKTAIVAASPTPGSAADLKPGKSVYIFAFKAPDGTLHSNNVTVEKNGVKPPT